MKKNEIKSEMLLKSVENRILIVDFKRKMAWDVTKYHESLVNADDRVPEGSDFISAINIRVLLTSFSVNSMWVSCESKDIADGDLDEINWNLSHIINLDASPDKQLFESIEAGILSAVE